jgi:CRP/FNR family cyclic AMP-dependent transcriptional regulator
MVLDERPRCASVITLEAARVAAVPRKRVTQFLESHPRIALALVQKLVRHLCALTQKVKTLGLVNVYGRVARLLIEHSTVEGGATVVERMTHQDIANRVGASREMISKVLKELSCQGYIRVDKRHITLLKRPPLGSCSHVIFSHRRREPHY